MDAIGRLSDDGQWRWDGMAWQPVQADAAGATPATSDIAVTFGHATAEAHTAPDGTPAIIVNFGITNTGTIPIESRPTAGRLLRAG